MNKKINYHIFFHANLFKKYFNYVPRFKNIVNKYLKKYIQISINFPLFYYIFNEKIGIL